MSAKDSNGREVEESTMTAKVIESSTCRVSAIATCSVIYETAFHRSFL